MLTDKGIQAAKALKRPYKLSDQGGLYLLVHPNGGKYWRLKYRYLGKEKMLSLGVYRHEVVDRQLAHAPRSKIDRA